LIGRSHHVLPYLRQSTHAAAGAAQFMELCKPSASEKNSRP
jgi:hypothetical protein